MSIQLQLQGQQSRRLRKWRKKFGLIDRLVTDQGRHFCNEQIAKWGERNQVHHIFTISYDHMSDGVVQRCKRIVLQMLQKLCTKSPHMPWWKLIREVELHVNLSCHEYLRKMPIEIWRASSSELLGLAERR